MSGLDGNPQSTAARYERMEFADFLVSTVLQTLSGSLVRLAGAAGDELGRGHRKTLQDSVQRVFSAWQMVQWSVPKLLYRQAQADLGELLSLCAGPRSAELSAAQRLLDRAEPKAARALSALIVELTPTPGGGAAAERANQLLQAESLRWRQEAVLRQIPQADLIEHGMLRAYRKAANLNRKLDQEQRGGGGKRLRRAARWSRHCLHHLELLRPALSESGQARCWHMQRLARKLDEQWALEQFAAAAVDAGLKPKALRRVDGLVQEQRKRLAKQRQKLLGGAFDGGEPAFLREVADAVGQLGLESISLLPLEGVRPRD